MKIEELKKLQNLSRLEWNVTQFHRSRSDAFDIEQNVSRWLFRETISKTLIWEVCYLRRIIDTIYLKHVTIGQFSVPI